jgi:hypothetical protein
MFRLRAPGAQAREAAAELLGLLKAELTIDGSGVVLRYVAGSRDEFEELCQFIREAGVGRA